MHLSLLPLCITFVVVACLICNRARLRHTTFLLIRHFFLAHLGNCYPRGRNCNIAKRLMWVGGRASHSPFWEGLSFHRTSTYQLLSTENVVADASSKMVQVSENSNNNEGLSWHSQSMDFAIVLSYFFKSSNTFFIKDAHRVLYPT